MGRTLGGIALCLIALFVGIGFLQVGTVTAASIVALAIGAGIPGGLGLALLLFRGPKREEDRDRYLYGDAPDGGSDPDWSRGRCSREETAWERGD